MIALLDRVLSIFKQAKNTPPVQTSCLVRLPTELILLICSHLSCVDTACLALCCHQTYYKIGGDSLAFSKVKDSVERKEFLARISQEFPAYFLCQTCSYLHEWAKVSPPWPSKENSRGRCIFSRSPSMNALTHTKYEALSPYDLDFVHVQLIMREHYYGPRFGFPAQWLDYVEVAPPRSGSSFSVTTLMTVEARVCPELQSSAGSSSLCLRIQQWAVIPLSFPDLVTLSDLVHMRICQHISAWHKTPLFHLHELESPGSVSSQHTCYQCPLCLAHFEFQSAEIEDKTGGKARALIITKWFDLGDGSDEDNSNWSDYISGRIKRKSPYQSLGSIRSRFETQHGICRQQLTLLNRDLLTRDKYRRKLHLYRGEIWTGRSRRTRDGEFY